MNWREFWNGTHSIYVNERHRALHYDRIAKDIASLVPSPDACVLDYGCGEAESSDIVARRCAMLYLYDTAPNVQARLRARFAGNDRLVVLSSEALEAMTDHSLDVVVANSVIQYLTHKEFEALLDLAQRKLKPDGKLIIADVIPETANFIDDVRALLGFALQGGFLLPALAGLASTIFSQYRKLRQEIGLTRYAEEDIQTLFSAHGYRAERSLTNIGHNQSRMMFTARPL